MSKDVWVQVPPSAPILINIYKMSEIQVKNTLSKKLKREYDIVIPFSQIDKKIDERVSILQKDYKMKGFRNGQVPLNIIKQKHAASIMAEESEKIINETSQNIVKKDDIKLATTPKVNVSIFELNKDLSYKLEMEIFPEVPKIDISKLKLNKKEAKILEEEVSQAKDNILARYKKWNKQEDSYKSKKGNAVNINYVGKIDGKEFDGGKADNHQLELGSKSFIDNFEDQLIGKKAGDNVEVKVKFPKEYHNADFAGKKAIFDVLINDVSTQEELNIDDNFVKENFKIETVDKFDEEIRNKISESYQELSRAVFKNDLLELLNKKVNFDLPESLIEDQFKRLWSEVETQEKQNPNLFKNDKDKKKMEDEKRKLASKMIKGGIIVSNINQENNISVSNEEIISEAKLRAAKMPGQEQMVLQYYQNNPEAMQDLRGFLMEEKMLDLVIEKAKPGIKTLSVKDLQKELNNS